MVVWFKFDKYSAGIKEAEGCIRNDNEAEREREREPESYMLSLVFLHLVQN